MRVFDGQLRQRGRVRPADDGRYTQGLFDNLDQLLDMVVGSRHGSERHNIGLVIEDLLRVLGQGRVRVQAKIVNRDNWYLDAWCHLRKGLRSFALDAMSSARVLDRPAIDVSDARLDAVLGAGYGIFAGKKVQWAELRFSAERARWVSAETWHPKQQGRFDTEGRYLLRLPYADPRELVMDILRHVPEVEVLGPARLREAVDEKLRATLARVTL